MGMENSQLTSLYKNLEGIRHQNGTEYWFARDLYALLGYAEWEDYTSALERAKQACIKSAGSSEDHFRFVDREFTNKEGNKVTIQDIRLSRYASYLVALNGDPKKEAVAFAQAYFVTQSRKIEVLQQKMIEFERIDVREKLKITEKEFSSTIFNRGVSGEGIAKIKSQGDKALFGGLTTQDMKNKLGISTANKPLADFLPSVTLKAKDLAMAMTTENTKRKDLTGSMPIMNEHVISNDSVRGALKNTGILPENLPAGEDIQKIHAAKKKELKSLQGKKRVSLFFF